MGAFDLIGWLPGIVAVIGIAVGKWWIVLLAFVGMFLVPVPDDPAARLAMMTDGEWAFAALANAGIALFGFLRKQSFGVFFGLINLAIVAYGYSAFGI